MDDREADEVFGHEMERNVAAWLKNKGRVVWHQCGGYTPADLIVQSPDGMAFTYIDVKGIKTTFDRDAQLGGPIMFEHQYKALCEMAALHWSSAQIVYAYKLGELAMFNAPGPYLCIGKGYNPRQPHLESIRFEFKHATFIGRWDGEASRSRNVSKCQ